MFDCGATDTMTFYPTDLKTEKMTPRTHIQTANGECIPIKSSRSVELSPDLSLSNCLLIPSLSHKPLSVNQLMSKELNCTVLMSSNGCVVQDVQTGKILGSGTESGSLYYVDDVLQQGHAVLAHGSPDHQLQMWDRRLRHPSLGYLDRTFPSLKNVLGSLD